MPGSSLWCWDGSLVAVVSFAGAATETCRFNHVGVRFPPRPGLAAKYNYASSRTGRAPPSTTERNVHDNGTLIKQNVVERNVVEIGLFVPFGSAFTFLGIMVVLRLPPRWACHALEDA